MDTFKVDKHSPTDPDVVQKLSGEQRMGLIFPQGNFHVINSYLDFASCSKKYFLYEF